MKQIIVITLACVLILGLITGCSKSKQAEFVPEGSSDEELFQLGEEHIKKDPEKGRLYLRQIIDTFPKSFYAQRAKLSIADSYFRQRDEGSMIIAASEYREFIQLYPYSPSAAYAQYQIGLTYYKKILKPGRDQSKTHQALAELRIVINKYPLSEEAEQAREKIQECEEQLAEHSISIAELYYKRRAYRASISRLTEILTEYPNYLRMDKVYFLLADSYYKSTLVEESVPYFRKLISDYPKSKYAHKAVKIMDEIEKSQDKKD